VHGAIIAYLRETGESKLSGHIAALTDQQITERMFSHGLRLTQFGQQIMQHHFQSCKISVPDNELRHPTHLILLDTIAKLPYYCGDDHLVVYDHQLGFRLRLIEGRLSILKQIT